MTEDFSIVSVSTAADNLADHARIRLEESAMLTKYLLHAAQVATRDYRAMQQVTDAWAVVLKAEGRRAK